MPNGAHSFVKAEALKVSYRQTREGMVIAFAIKPEDMPPELALAPVGTRVLLAVAELRDDAPEPEPVSEPPKPKNERLSEAGREAYAQDDDMGKAARRAGMLCKDEAFARWLERKFKFVPGRIVDSATCADFLRRHLFIGSRSEIATDARAYRDFVAMETTYQMDTGLLPSPR
jgi:hypothetical protein